jgi:hypothetical protein
MAVIVCSNIDAGVCWGEVSSGAFFCMGHVPKYKLFIRSICTIHLHITVGFSELVICFMVTIFNVFILPVVRSVQVVVQVADLLLERDENHLVKERQATCHLTIISDQCCIDVFPYLLYLFLC